MPQAPRKDNQIQRAQDKESKRARGALSCAECRRLKLKCDKTVPCSSCKRRGCSAICPNGSLITGQGTRFVLADTETLHQKIAHMSDRIRQLEDALAILQSTVSGPSGEPHPLLHRDLLKIKSSIELHSASTLPGGDEHLDREEEDEGEKEDYIDAFGTLAIRDDGAATFYGRSAGSESLLIGESSSQSPTLVEPSSPHRYAPTSSYGDPQTRSPHHDQVNGYQRSEGYPHFASTVDSDGSLPSSITTVAASFPLAPSLSYSSSSGSSSLSSPSTFSSNGSLYHPQPPLITVQTLTANFLPSYAEAIRLVQLYLEQAPWFFGAVTRKQIEEEILPLWYEEAAAAAPSASTPPAGGLQTTSTATVNGKSQQRVGTSHDLALLFIVFCFGALTDINLPSPPDNVPAEKFYQLTKVSLTLDPASMIVPDLKAPRNGVLERPPSVATVQTLSLMAIYEGICSGENSIETTWALMGLACKLSQSIGLHRDCARWKLTPAEVQKRRALFWELFITDCWQSLATGRLATFSLPFVDCELPADPDKTIADDGSIQPSFPYWKARFGAECVSAVVQGTLTSRAPKYSIILDLDRKVRDMELPQYAQGPTPQGLGLAQTMSHFMPHNYRELTLLYIHRCFFAHAISSNPLDPIKSQYAPSFLAGYRSACTIVASVKKQFEMFPAQIARFWVLWTHAFSASVMLASVATHSSRSKIAPAALLELKNACDLFETASPYGGRAGKFLPILKRLQTKAQNAYRDANNGVVNIPNDIFKPSQPDEAKDELSIFSGKTHTVSTKVGSGAALHSSTSTSNSIPTSRTSSKSSLSESDSPQQILTDNPSFAGVHPSLVSELNVFHGQIKAQIQNAYRTGGEVFGAGPMVVDPVPRAPVRPKASAQQLQQQQAQQQVQRQHAHQQAQLLQQQHQQALYQQAKHQQEQLERQEMERLEREREEAERREAERLEFERQELARKQHLQQLEIQRQQNQQQELQRQQQAQEQQQRQLEIEQRQRQEQYHQQLEIQQQQQQMAQRHMYEGPQQAMYTNVAPAVPAPPTHAPQVPPVNSRHQGHPSNPQTQHGMQQQQTYQPQHPQQQHYQFMPRHEAPVPQSAVSVSYNNPPPAVVAPQHHTHVSRPPITPQHTGGITVDSQHHSRAPQHPTYAATSSPSKNTPPEYSYYPSPESMHSGSSSAHYTPPTTSYGGSQSQPSASMPPNPTAASTSYIPETYRYWPAASTSFAMPDQQATGPSAVYAPPHGYQQHQQQYQQPGYPQYQHQHYTPEGALRGIAADDSSLQETWQSYMNKVGSPRQFLED